MHSGSKERLTKWKEAKAVYSELATARELASTSRVLSETKRQAED